MVDRLREQSVAVTAFNGGEAAQSKDKYFNRRAESYWTLREAFSKGEISIRGTSGDVESLIAELTSLKYDFRSDGRIQLETKADLKKRGFRSPDRADVMAMGVGYLRGSDGEVKAWGRRVFGPQRSHPNDPEQNLCQIC